MFILKKLFLILFVTLSVISNAQCNYTLNSFTHVDCYGENTGSIQITTLNSSASFWWSGPNGFTSMSSNLTDLFAGKYTLTIMDNVIPGDTNSALVCVLIDTIIIQQTIPITASFELSNMCNENDSADVNTAIWGGTPPYLTLWNTGDTSRNAINLAPNPSLPYTLTITDANFCVANQFLTIPIVSAINPFMSSEGVICKDDYSGSARVFVTQGTPPFTFRWQTDPLISIEHDSFSVIEELFPGEYIVDIIDAMGCKTSDTIEVVSNPKLCLTIYKAFSPNDDAIHEFWEIENINLYPEALVVVYDRTGRQVYRRRNYKNSEGLAFGGKDQEGRVLPSGGYYYVIDLENGDDVFKGVLTIVR
tara:strand:+ start:107 stop:1192 length:1086 start_codon:yes stop_codon:yes gene_type:complete